MLKHRLLWTSTLCLAIALSACSSGDLPSPEAPVVNATATPVVSAHHYAAPVQKNTKPQATTISKTSSQSVTPKNTSATPTIANQGGWLWPVQGTVINNKHASEALGIDIRTQAHSSVHAAKAGEVVYAGNGIQGYGNLIIIKHGSEFLSAYAYNAKNLVHEGQQVKAGQIIATVQGTQAMPNVLHFEIRDRGEPVNPLQYLPKQG